MNPELSRTITGVVLGLILGGLITYSIHLILSDMQSKIKYIMERQDELDKAFLRFLMEFKELLLTEMERRDKANQQAKKETDNEVEKG